MGCGPSWFIEVTPIEVISDVRCFGGRQRTYRHHSAQTHTPMQFAAFLPPAAEHEATPVLWWLSGLTCTEDNFSQKAGAQRLAAELGVMLIMPDTSPRGEGVPDDPDGAFDFGLGAGFYVDATEAPWAAHYRMYAYVASELPTVVAANLPADLQRQSIFGHSMGGHGALTIGLRNPGRFRSISAFAPIAAPSRSPWGRKAFLHYLGPDERRWRAFDAAALIEDGARGPQLLIDQGEADPWLASHLRLDLLETVCAEARQPITCRRQPGYDHSFHFISTFVEDHLRWHADHLV